MDDSETKIVEYITLDDYFKKMESLGYVASEDIVENAHYLLLRVNSLIDNLFTNKLLPIPFKITLASGWRTSDHNKQVKGAKFSSHITGNALDLEGYEVAVICMKNPALLSEYDLFMESMLDAPQHTHLQDIAPKSGKRIFRA